MGEISDFEQVLQLSVVRVAGSERMDLSDS